MALENPLSCKRLQGTKLLASLNTNVHFMVNRLFFLFFFNTCLVRQEVVGNATTVLDYVLASDVERDRLLKEETNIMQKSEDRLQEEKEKDAARLIEIYNRLNEIDYDNASSRAIEILSGLNFTKKMMVKVFFVLF